MGLYLPPPASIRVLNQIISKIAAFGTDNVVILGDFNLVPDPTMDRLTSGTGSPSELSSWAEASNLTDVWRWRHPSRRAYTCHSASHKTLSRIDLAYVGGSVLPMVRDIKILPRGISDHAPLALKLCVSNAPGENLWRLSRFWLNDTRVSEPYRSEAIHYWRDLDQSVTMTTSWDAFKAFTRGSFQAHIQKIRQDLRKETQTAEGRVAALEAAYSTTRSPETYSDFLSGILILCS